MEERFILPLWALLYPCYNNNILHECNEMAERKKGMTNMLCSQREFYNATQS